MSTIYEQSLWGKAKDLIAAIISFLARYCQDIYTLVKTYGTKFIQFLFPVWFRQWTVETHTSIANAAREAVAKEWFSSDGSNGTFLDHMLEKLDLDKDGHISASEWLIGTENSAEEMRREVETFFQHYYNALSDPDTNQNLSSSWMAWLRTKVSTIMTADWSMGAYLWHTCSGLILVLIVTSIVPGRLHGWTGRALRFPVLGMVYMLVAAELGMYIIVRLTIRIAEILFANPKHRALRRSMARATSYREWYEIAKWLDESQGRDKWQDTVNDDTAYRYSWPFVLELLSDLKSSREKNDIIMALAVLQQCTRKNIGGIMSEDMFSFTNCGEPKKLVSEFIEEVVTTMKWVTNEVVERTKTCEAAALTRDSEKKIDVLEDAVIIQSGSSKTQLESQRDFDNELKSKIEEEQNKLFGHIVSWAAHNLLGMGDDKNDESKHERSNVEDATTTPQTSEPSDEDKKSEESDENEPFDENTEAYEEYTRALVHREKIKTFLKRARAAYGRTALCLSGGAMMGCYHFGSVQALLQTGLLPHIISGTSAGSVIGAMICTRTDEELENDLKPEVLAPKMSIFASSWMDRWTRWCKHGTMFDQEDWMRRVKWFTSGDMTFEEAYKKTGRVLCITLSATTKKAPPVLINYITAPNVVIGSAVLASAAVPGFIDAMRLQVKDENGVVRYMAKLDERYRDGSIESDIPVNGLAEQLNCQFFLAAQANPHIVPFFYNAKGDVGRPSRWSSGKRDDSWRGGFFLSALEMYLKNDMRSKFHFLNDMEVAVGFTSTMMTQTYSGTTTIVPQVCLRDFFLLFSAQSLDDMKRYFQGGSVAAYQHVAMLKLHYKIAYALDECLATLEHDEAPSNLHRRRSQLLMNQSSKPGGLNFATLSSTKENLSSELDSSTPSSSLCDNDYEGGFDGVECAFGPGRRS
mmetsp:Transcript_24265/g.50332  ORF Transcript_24265/g.50332 Transcript_24265/m.50332 type:complete len:920 (+) Transcript_24265:174-2933(+)|eukprot:CAMPEP_0171352072 /NCGR_PEP_ID=MMETSP0878-20121228/40547_1 /TAXON_ID=67004 /ORGANISM="Thalassiosira weissflogii, Strain CCMP1336" /LENGTH=919 /DNA_ID=CAMNT_0011857543 /DNA_START=93 /DNA_END=2852 /DNA_ORIENTATION=-